MLYTCPRITACSRVLQRSRLLGTNLFTPARPRLPDRARLRLAAPIPCRGCQVGPVRRTDGLGRRGAAGDGLRDDHRGAADPRALYRHRDDCDRRPVRFLAPADQRPDQCHFHRGIERRGGHRASRATARRDHPDDIHDRVDPARHLAVPPRRPDTLHIPLGHRRLHLRRRQPAGDRPDEEPVRHAGDGRPARPPALPLLAVDDPGWRIPTRDDAGGPGVDRAGDHAARAQAAAGLGAAA